ncbi:MAG: putative lipid II flippase FtsW [Streptosporangiaceae bacterium]
MTRDAIPGGRPPGPPGVDDGAEGSHGHAAGLLPRERMAAFCALLGRPLLSYYLVMGIAALLLALGLVMVLSTSSASALVSGAPLYQQFQKQLLGVALGLPIMWFAARSSPRLFRAAAYPLLVIAVLGLVLTLIPGVGVTSGGASRWIDVGPFQLQPSELAKFAFLVWGADLLARKEQLGQLTEWRHLLLPLLPGAGAICMLVMLGDDLGTTFVLLVIFLTLLWAIGTPGRLFAAMLGLIGLVMVMMIVVHPYELQRLTNFMNGQSSPTGVDMQRIQGEYAVGSGGWFGVGLGASKEKWGWVPNATTDYIFAIIGEELGLVGTLCVSVRYGGLAYAGLRIARRVDDTFMRLAAAGATAWIVIQAVVNIGAVIGVLPITGVPLPLVSYGVSSLLTTMAALGMLMSFAKREPGAREALAGQGESGLRRVLSWLGLAGGRQVRA